MKLLGQRLGLAVLLALSVLALGARQMVLAQETDDPVKIEIYKRFVDNRQEQIPQWPIRRRATIFRNTTKTKTSTRTICRSG